MSNEESQKELAVSFAERLNRLIQHAEDNRNAVADLIEARVPCSQALADADCLLLVLPQRRSDGDFYGLGVLGLLNGILRTFGVENPYLLVAVYDELPGKTPETPGEYLRHFALKKEQSVYEDLIQEQKQGSTH